MNHVIGIAQIIGVMIWGMAMMLKLVVSGIIFLPIIVMAVPGILKFRWKHGGEPKPDFDEDVQKLRSSWSTGPFIWMHKWVMCYGDGNRQRF